MSADNVTFVFSNGGMHVGDWITLAAVIVALVLGVVTIIQTYRSQKRERKERLVSEIIEWATVIAKSTISRQTKDTHQLWKTKLEYKILATKGITYIKGISASMLKELVPLIDDIDTKLEHAMSELEKVISYR